MDYRMFKAINGLAGRSLILDLFMILISNKVRYVFALVVIFLWFRNKSYKKVTHNTLISILLALLMNTLFKLVSFKSRPYKKHRTLMLIPAKNDSSFPSKHVLLTSAVSTSILLRKRILGMLMWILSILTGISRIWVGHHYPSDIVGSAIIGSSISIFTDRYLHNKRKIYKE